MAHAVGIDVSKDWLDIAQLETGARWRLANDAPGWSQLVERLKRHSQALIGLEASGGYEQGVMRALLRAGLQVRRINPLRLRRFAQAAGVKAKNDRLDARMIALFVATLPTRPAKLDPTRERLAELVSARRQLQDDLVRLDNQAAHDRLALTIRLRRRQIALLKAQVALLDKHIAQLVNQAPEMARKAALMRSMPCIGPVVSQTLLALMPELGELTARQAAALVGVAPFDHDSGKLKGQRAIWGGRQSVRNALYMAAMVAGQHNATLRAFRQRLISAGKPPKLALVALMRKIIVTLNAILRTNTPWRAPLP